VKLHQGEGENYTQMDRGGGETEHSSTLPAFQSLLRRGRRGIQGEIRKGGGREKRRRKRKKADNLSINVFLIFIGEKGKTRSPDTRKG